MKWHWPTACRWRVLQAATLTSVGDWKIQITFGNQVFAFKYIDRFAGEFLLGLLNEIVYWIAPKHPSTQKKSKWWGNYQIGEKHIYFCVSNDGKITRAAVSPVKNMRVIRTRRETTRAREAHGMWPGMYQVDLRTYAPFSKVNHGLRWALQCVCKFEILGMESFQWKFFRNSTGVNFTLLAHPKDIKNMAVCAPLTCSAFQIIIKRFVDTESGSGVILSWPMHDRNIVYRIFPCSEIFTYIMLRYNY